MSVFERVLKRFKTTTRTEAMAVVGQDTGLEEALSEELCVLFKHSTACPVSWAAHAQVTRFARENPDTPVYMIPVLKERPISQRVAAVTGVTHESPQVIVLRDGVAAASASHGEITVESLAEMVVTSPSPI